MKNMYNDHNITMVIEAYGEWIHEHMAYGWSGYFLSFMFDQMQGSEYDRMAEMKKTLGWFYGRLAKASVPKASSSKWSEFLPKAVLAPDFPVFKHSKQQLKDVIINNGLHWHGLVVVHPLTPKLREPLDLHIERNLSRYLAGNIRNIGVRCITHEPEYVTGYGMKGLKRSSLSDDDILIFPRTVSELPSKVLFGVQN
jgi:hypothetical protein